MQNDNENDSLIEREETEEIVEREMASSALSKVSLVFVALSIAFCFHSVYSIIGYLSDNSVPLVNCPKSYELDAPVLLKPIREEGIKAQDRWIRGFMRRYVLSQFPRSPKDVKKFFEYASKHSKGAVKEKFDSLLIDKETITGLVRSGYFYRFYPKFGEGSEMRIRATDVPTRYIVEVDGFLIKKMNHIQERYTPTLRYVVEIGKPTLSNPEGLYVIDGNIEQITDYVSGTKEKL